MRALLLPSLVLLASCAGTGPASTVHATLTADEIHDRCLTLDTHKDINDSLSPRELPADPATAREFRLRYDPTVDGKQQVDFVKMRAGGYDCAFYIVYVAQRKLTDSGFARAYAEAKKKFDAIHRMCRMHRDTIGLATSADQVEWLHQQGKLIACIGIENGYPMGTDLRRIEEFHQRGARYMSIAHNGHTQLGDSHTPADEPLHGGLSELGRAAIAEMNRVGIMVDVSHAAKSTMLQAVALSKAPVIASHSGARAVNDHSRNLDDEQLRAIKANGGVVQCVALASFLKSNEARSAALRKLQEEIGLKGPASEGLSEEERTQLWEVFRQREVEVNRVHPPADVSVYCDHIDHIVEVAGIDHVGIGSDFDGGGGIGGWQNAAESRNVTRELVKRGYSEQDVQKIWSGNLLRVWRAVEGVSAAW
ncbi:MAG: dipeptidase [Planctomycetota bacterium]|nr:dipeptidase [Planctomycetota bacterium]